MDIQIATSSSHLCAEFEAYQLRVSSQTINGETSFYFDLVNPQTEYDMCVCVCFHMESFKNALKKMMPRATRAMRDEILREEDPWGYDKEIVERINAMVNKYNG